MFTKKSNQKRDDLEDTFEFFPLSSLLPNTSWRSGGWFCRGWITVYNLSANSGKEEGEREDWRDRNSDSERYKLVFHG